MAASAIELVEAVWPLDPDERQEWVTGLRDLDLALVPKTVVVLRDAHMGQPSFLQFLATYMGVKNAQPKPMTPHERNEWFAEQRAKLHRVREDREVRRVG